MQNVNFPESPTLLTRALAFAQTVQGDRKWLDGTKPYLHFSLAVSACVLRYGGTEAQAAAALAYGTIEMLKEPMHELSTALSPEVARLAHAFCLPVASDWGTAKKLYLTRLKETERQAVFIVACAELQALDDLMDALREQPAIKVWANYPTPRHNLGWYFREILAILQLRWKTETTPQEAALLATYAARVRIFLQVAFEAASKSEN